MIKAYAAGLCAAIVAVTALAVASASSRSFLTLRAQRHKMIEARSNFGHIAIQL
jgi:hypothetical protein